MQWFNCDACVESEHSSREIIFDAIADRTLNIDVHILSDIEHPKP